MSFPRYPAYFESAVPWLGEVPQHWQLLPAKRGFRREKELNTGMVCENRLALTMGGVVPRALDDLDGLQASEFETYQIFQRNDLAFKLIDLQNIKTSRVGLVPEYGIMSPAYIRLCPNPDLIQPKFAYWFFTDLYNRQVFNQLGGGVRQTIGSEELLVLPIPYPPKLEQEHIGRFLDHETAKIDVLVTEQERLIELLKEKRQAVISHAVTKGLDPSVPMKDSGVEWLGQVPAHWELRQVRNIASFLTSGPRGWSERVGEEGSLFVQSGDLTDDLGIAFSQAKRVAVENDAEAARTRLLVGDVVVCITGAKTGNVAVCAAVEEDAYINQHLCLIRPTADVLPWFLGVFLKSDAGQRYFGIAQYGLKQGLSLENVKATPLLVPPASEQEALVAAVTRASEQMDQLIGEAVLSIELLRERRTALISAAVTGQIDVRGWVTAETAA